MKNWDSLFGEVPESFSRRVHDTVDRLERQESAPRPAFRLYGGFHRKSPLFVRHPEKAAAASSTSRSRPH